MSTYEEVSRACSASFWSPPLQSLFLGICPVLGVHLLSQLILQSQSLSWLYLCASQVLVMAPWKLFTQGEHSE